MKSATRDLIVGQKNKQQRARPNGLKGLCGSDRLHTCDLRHTPQMYICIRSHARIRDHVVHDGNETPETA